MSRSAAGRVFLFSWKRLEKDLNVKFIWKFNDSFTYRGCLHCAILEVWYNVKEKRTHKARHMHFFPSKCSKRDFQDFENAWKQYGIHQRSLMNQLKNKQEREKHHTNDILILSLLLIIIMVDLLRIHSAVELQFLKSLKVYCSNTACFSSMCPIYHKQSQNDW